VAVHVKFSFCFPDELVVQSENVEDLYIYILFVPVDLDLCGQLIFGNKPNVFTIIVILLPHMLPCFSAGGSIGDSLLQLLNIMGLII
jgi:hypothetical protein